jgi:hypothetical protein
MSGVKASAQSSPRIKWRTRISCHASPDTAACAAFVTESSMKLANATNLNRKSGGGDELILIGGASFVWIKQRSGGSRGDDPPYEAKIPPVRALHA